MRPATAASLNLVSNASLLLTLLVLALMVLPPWPIALLVPGFATARFFKLPSTSAFGSGFGETLSGRATGRERQDGQPSTGIARRLVLNPLFA